MMNSALNAKQTEQLAAHVRHSTTFLALISSIQVSATSKREFQLTVSPNGTASRAPLVVVRSTEAIAKLAAAVASACCQDESCDVCASLQALEENKQVLRWRRATRIATSVIQIRRQLLTYLNGLVVRAVDAIPAEDDWSCDGLLRALVTIAAFFLRGQPWAVRTSFHS